MAENATIAALRAASQNAPAGPSGPQALSFPWMQAQGRELVVPDRAPIDQQAWRDSLLPKPKPPATTIPEDSGGQDGGPQDSDRHPLLKNLRPVDPPSLNSNPQNGDVHPLVKNLAPVDPPQQAEQGGDAGQPIDLSGLMLDLPVPPMPAQPMPSQSMPAPGFEMEQNDYSIRLDPWQWEFLMQ